jgi:maltose O-acetyltransferase
MAKMRIAMLQKPLRFMRRIWYLAKSRLLSASFKACGPSLYIGPGVSIQGYGQISIGTNVRILRRSAIVGGGGLTIGDNVRLAPGVTILTRNHNYKGDALPYDEGYINKPVIIQDNVWIGTRAIILPGVTVGEGAIIAAGAVVTKNVPRLAICGGNPARTLKVRDPDHYERVKASGLTHRPRRLGDVLEDD